MAASVLYFGPDEWHRVQVLEDAGYAVHTCGGIEDLESALKVPPQPSVVVMNSLGHAYLKPAIEIIHRQAALAPVIVFPSDGESQFEAPVDLVVPPLTPPEEWLGEMAELIARCQALREDSIALQEQSATMRQQSAAARSKSVTAMARSARLRGTVEQGRERSRTLRDAVPKNLKPEK